MTNQLMHELRNSLLIEERKKRITLFSSPESQIHPRPLLLLCLVAGNMIRYFALKAKVCYINIIHVVRLFIKVETTSSSHQIRLTLKISRHMKLFFLIHPSMMSCWRVKVVRKWFSLQSHPSPCSHSHHSLRSPPPHHHLLLPVFPSQPPCFQ